MLYLNTFVVLLNMIEELAIFFLHCDMKVGDSWKILLLLLC